MRTNKIEGSGCSQKNGNDDDTSLGILPKLKKNCTKRYSKKNSEQPKVENEGKVIVRG